MVLFLFLGMQYIYMVVMMKRLKVVLFIMVLGLRFLVWKLLIQILIIESKILGVDEFSVINVRLEIVSFQILMLIVVVVLLGFFIMIFFFLDVIILIVDMKRFVTMEIFKNIQIIFKKQIVFFVILFFIFRLEIGCYRGNISFFEYGLIYVL